MLDYLMWDSFFFNELLIFVGIPEIVFLKLGLKPEEMTVIPFLLFWVVAIYGIYLAIKGILRLIRLIYVPASTSHPNPRAKEQP